MADTKFAGKSARFEDEGEDNTNATDVKRLAAIPNFLRRKAKYQSLRNEEPDETAESSDMSSEHDGDVKTDSPHAVQLNIQPLEVTQLRVGSIETERKERWRKAMWIGLTFLTHSLWGIYPVLVRNLSVVHKVPTLSLMAAANLINVPVMLLATSGSTGGSIQYKELFSKTMLYLEAIIVLRSVSNILAPHFTLAIWCQLITLSTPFLVALFSSLILKETLPPFTIPSMVLSSIGGFLMLFYHFQESSQAESSWSSQDLLGMALAAFSSVCLALYMIMVKRTASKKTTSATTVLFAQLLALLVYSLVISVAIGEDWSVYLHMSGATWSVFLVFAVGVLLLGNVGQTFAIREVGAPVVSSVLPFRMVAALFAGYFLLGEQLKHWTQFLGAAVCLLSLTAYLTIQIFHKKR